MGDYAGRPTASNVGYMTHNKRGKRLCDFFLRGACDATLPLYAALCSTEPTSAPLNYCWTLQIAPELAWFASFSKQQEVSLSACLIEHYLEPINAVDFVLHASPWSLEGILPHNRVPTEYFAGGLCSEDVSRFRCVLGDLAEQQVWESLAAIVAVRLWKTHWQQRRVLNRQHTCF